MQSVRDFLCFLVFLGTNRQAEHRPWQLDRLQVEVVFVVRVMKDGIVMRFFNARYGADITGHRRFLLVVLLTVDLQQLRGFEGLARVADV